MKKKDHYITFILKYLEGGLSPDDEMKLHQWIYQNKKNRHFFEQVKQNWREDVSINPAQVFNTQQAFEKVYIQLGLNTESKSRQSVDFRKWLKMAAVLAGIFIISEFVYLGLLKSTVTYSTQEDQTATIVLPDQSVVTLYANSSIAYSEKWDEQKFRTVSLEGEAFFDVTKNPDKPFLVNTSEITVRVLGTSFNVKNYHGDNYIETTLVEGSVEVNQMEDMAAKVILVPHQRAVFSKKTRDLKLAKVNVDHYAALKNESFIFNNENVGEIIKVISKKFTVSIKTENNNINNCTITADFSDQPLRVTLDLLCKLIDATYSIDGNKVRLKGEGCEVN